MSRIKIGNGTEKIRRPSIEYLATTIEVQRTEISTALRVRAKINRFRIRVIKIELNAVAHLVPQRDLQRVVIRKPDRALGEQRHVLRVIERIGPSGRIAWARWMSRLAATGVTCCVRYPAVFKTGDER